MLIASERCAAYRELNMDDSQFAQRPAPAARRIEMDDPWAWLAAGWSDICQRPAISLGYGAAFTLISYLLAGCLYYLDLIYLLLPLGAAFMLVGPMLAVGLYEASRCLAAGRPVRAADVVFVATKSPTQLAFIGLLLLLALLAWIRVATLLFALFFGTETPPLAELIPNLLLTTNGVAFLVTGTAIGAVIAFCVFSISAVSVPMLMVRETDAITAIIASIQAVRRNPGPMLLWAWLIAAMLSFGMATLFLGLIVTFPLIGHATWHAYGALIED